MRGDATHLGERLQDLIDGRLSSDDRAAADAHVAECASCRRELEALAVVRHGVRRAAAAGAVPSELGRRIREALAAEGGAAASVPREETRSVSRRAVWVWVAAAAALFLALLAGLLLRPGVAGRVAGDYAGYRAGTLPLERETADAAALAAFFRARGVTVRVMDLGMMGYRLVGGRVHRLGDRPSVLYVYRGEGNKILVCQMYGGEIGALPGSTEVREANGIAFQIVRRDRETMVFWQEGDVACVLVSDIPAEEVVALAVAKAMKA